MMPLFIIFALAVTVFTARTPEEWETWLNSWFVENEDNEQV